MRRITALIVLILAASPVHAQFASVRGRVLEAGPDVPLVGATVSVLTEDGLETGTVTDATGRYAIRRIRPGTAILSVRFLGFVTYSDTLSLEFDQNVQYDITLERDEARLDEVIVDAERTSGASRAAGLVTIEPSALARVPMPGVSYDLAGYLLTLPGFVSTGDRGGQLFVRGGTPTQNLVRVDGIPIFQPFHIVGFYSAFPADIIAFADVYAGGFGAKYGGRVSSVIDITSRNGNKRRVEGAASIAPFLSSIRFDFPVVRDKVSIVASARESLIERVAPDLLGQELPYRFGDHFLKLHAFLSQTSSLSFTGIHTYDRGDVGAGLEDGKGGPSIWRNVAGGFRFNYLPPEFPALAQFAMYVTRMSSRFEPADQVVQRSSVQSLTMETEISYLLGTTQIVAGLFGNLYRFEYKRGDSPFTEQEGITSGGGFIDGTFQIGDRLRVQPGVRLETFSQGIRSIPGPRLRFTVLPFGANSRQQISVAWGRYYQQIVGLNNERDVSDVFTIWTSSPSGTPVPQAEHFIAGIQQSLWRGFEVSVEGYYKKLDNIAFPVFNDTPDGFAGWGRARGTVQGVDTRIEIARRNWYFQGSYSLAEVEYVWTGDRRGVIRDQPSELAAPGTSFNPPHDRRHQVGLLSQIKLGRFSMNMRWQFGSGLPFTQINGFYRAFDLDPDDAMALYDDEGSARISRSVVYGGRLPDYHRLDVTIERVFEFPRAEAKVLAGAINTYDRPNIFAYNLVSGERVDQLPIIPTLGLEVVFK